MSVLVDALFCWFHCFCNWIIHYGIKSLSSLSALFLLLSVFSDFFCLTKHNTSLCPPPPPVHLPSLLFPFLPFSSSHCYPLSVHFYYYHLTFCISISHFSLPPSWTTAALLFSLFSISYSGSLSLYLFWWQSLLFTFTSLSLPVSVSLCFPDSLTHSSPLLVFPQGG